MEPLYPRCAKCGEACPLNCGNDGWAEYLLPVAAVHAEEVRDVDQLPVHIDSVIEPPSDDVALFAIEFDMDDVDAPLKAAPQFNVVHTVNDAATGRFSSNSSDASGSRISRLPAAPLNMHGDRCLRQARERV